MHPRHPPSTPPCSMSCCKCLEISLTWPWKFFVYMAGSFRTKRTCLYPSRSSTGNAPWTVTKNPIGKDRLKNTITPLIRVFVKLRGVYMMFFFVSKRSWSNWLSYILSAKKRCLVSDTTFELQQHAVQKSIFGDCGMCMTGCGFKASNLVWSCSFCFYISDLDQDFFHKTSWCSGLK